MFKIRRFLTICLLISGITVMLLHLPWSSNISSSSRSDSSINWHDNWAFGCTFGDGNDLATEKSVPAYRCNDMCNAEPECTHFVWTAAATADNRDDDGDPINGACRMKSGDATKTDAQIIVVVSSEKKKGAGAAAAAAEVETTVCGLAQKTVHWFGNWALGCAFNQQRDADASRSSSWSLSHHQLLVRGGSVIAIATGLERDKCAGKCKSTDYCSHFVWADGDCWLGRGRVDKSDAVVTGDMSMACGVVNDDGSFSDEAGESLS